MEKSCVEDQYFGSIKRRKNRKIKQQQWYMNLVTYNSVRPALTSSSYLIINPSSFFKSDLKHYPKYFCINASSSSLLMGFEM
jgi:hypothetical protein